MKSYPVVSLSAQPTAFISVYHKYGIVEFAQALLAKGWRIIASGGTAKHLRAAGVEVQDIADKIGMAILNHRVVTLHPFVHGGLLALDNPEHRAELAARGIDWIDMFCGDLYPLEEEIAKAGSTFESVIEQTDIGGPTMLRSAAKGRRIVICDPADRGLVLDWLSVGCPDNATFRNYLCAKAEITVANYCLASARYLSEGGYEGFIGERVQECKYGENAWQSPAALYRYLNASEDKLALHEFKLLEGDDPSFNNLCDADRALMTLTHIGAALDPLTETPKVAVANKHGNACGAAEHWDVRVTTKNMVLGNPLSVFGGVIMTNYEVTAELAEIMLKEGSEGHRVLSAVLAPRVTPEAVMVLRRKKGGCRILVNPALEGYGVKNLDRAPRFRPIRGGFLRQPNYTYVFDMSHIVLESGSAIGLDTDSVYLAWAIGSTSNSNTVTLVKDRMLIGNGVGQQDRVECCKLAIARARSAGHDPAGAIAYSDSFFPFDDGPCVLADAGVETILASSGSMQDEAVKRFCRERGLRLLLVPDAKGRGFFGH